MIGIKDVIRAARKAGFMIDKKKSHKGCET